MSTPDTIKFTLPLPAGMAEYGFGRETSLATAAIRLSATMEHFSRKWVPLLFQYQSYR